MKDETTVDYEYKVIKAGAKHKGTTPKVLEDTLNEETKGEWKYVDMVTTVTHDTVKVIFRRPA